MSKKDYCIYFVDLRHISTSKRREAAFWAVCRFGKDRVDIMNPKEIFTKEKGLQLIPGFWFAREKDVTMFVLMWSR